MHPPNGKCFAEFRIPEGSRYFRAILGMAKQDIHPNSFGVGGATILIDDNVVWGSGVYGNNIAQPTIPIPINSQVIRFETYSQSGRDNWSSHMTWANPFFSAV